MLATVVVHRCHLVGSLKACITPSNIMKANPQGGGFQVKVNLVLTVPVSRVLGFSSSRDLSYTSEDDQWQRSLPLILNGFLMSDTGILLVYGSWCEYHYPR